jgi:hypothetical protein
MCEPQAVAFALQLLPAELQTHINTIIAARHLFSYQNTISFDVLLTKTLPSGVVQECSEDRVSNTVELGHSTLSRQHYDHRSKHTQHV